MCVPGLLSGLIGLATTAVQMSHQSSIARKNEQAANDWAAYQQQERMAESQRQETQRKKAELARTDTLNQAKPEAMQEAQTEEASRLSEEFTSGVKDVDTTVADNLLSGQARGGQVFQDDLKSKLSSATAEAKKRIGALASLQSFGGSFGGLQTRNNEVALAGGNAIDLANNKRSGSLSAYGAAKAVNPVQYFG
jgi:DNA anti-recombination protein RmuC